MKSIQRRGAVMAVGGALVLVALGAAAGYWFAWHGAATSPNMTVAGAEKGKVLYWYDPMVPNQHFDKPGKSPFMDMQLLPKYADEHRGGAGIEVSPQIAQNLGLRTARVERDRLSQSVEAVGSVVFDERHMAIVQSRTNGFVSRTYGRAPGDMLERGAAIVDLLVPEWAGAQAEFLALVQSGDAALMEAARQRLVLLGMPPELITRIESTHRQQTTVTIAAPVAGALASLEVRDGMTVSAGATLARINGLDPVWLEAAIPESQSAAVAPGQAVQAHLVAYPGEIFKGHVAQILPEANVDTRAVRVRIELANPRLRLRPGMFARIRLATGNAVPQLWVPSEAVIHTGRRNLVIVAGDDNRFEPTQVQVGPEADDRSVILSGLEEGQKVVASAQFLIDSEANLRGVLVRLNGAGRHGTTEPAAGGKPGADTPMDTPMPENRP